MKGLKASQRSRSAPRPTGRTVTSSSGPPPRTEPGHSPSRSDATPPRPRFKRQLRDARRSRPATDGGWPVDRERGHVACVEVEGIHGPPGHVRGVQRGPAKPRRILRRLDFERVQPDQEPVAARLEIRLLARPAPEERLVPSGLRQAEQGRALARRKEAERGAALGVARAGCRSIRLEDVRRRALLPPGARTQRAERHGGRSRGDGHGRLMPTEAASRRRPRSDARTEQSPPRGRVAVDESALPPLRELASSRW